MTLSGTVSLVTGTASGIGRATAVALGAEGASVVAVDRDAAGLASLADLFASEGRAVSTIVVDLAELAPVGRLVDDAVERFGRLDHLVDSAGITGRSGSALEVDLAGWRTHGVRVNAVAPGRTVTA